MDRLTIFFDLDDTLYDRSIPYERAFSQFFGGRYAEKLPQAFDAVIHRGYEVFTDAHTGKISMEAMHIYRQDNPMIELRAISEDNFRECLLLRASVENEDFVDPVTYSLAEAWVYYQDTRPFAIYSDDTIVGFVSMYVGEDNYQIINFLIDDAFQRKGYGSKAVKLCIEYLQREFSACRISAPVKMEHIAAQEFWIKQGFCLSDTIEDGYVFMRLFLT